MFHLPIPGTRVHGGSIRLYYKKWTLFLWTGLGSPSLPRAPTTWAMAGAKSPRIQKGRKCCFLCESTNELGAATVAKFPAVLARIQHFGCTVECSDRGRARSHGGIPSCTTPLILRADVHAMQEEFDALAPGEARCLTDVLPGSRAQDAAPFAFRSRRLVTLLDALLLQLGWHGEGP